MADVVHMNPEPDLPAFAWERIGPDEARELLSRNENRNIRNGRVAMYSRDMREGRWLPRGDCIEIDREGKLRNGQHRLRAIAASGVTLWMPVMRDVRQDVQAVTDQGAMRHFGDVLKLSYGETDVNNYAAAVKQVNIYRRTGKLGWDYGFAQQSIAELTATYLAEPNLRRSLPYGKRLSAEMYTPQSVGAALHYLFVEKDEEAAEMYFRRATTGEMLAEGDAILALRKRLPRGGLERGRPAPSFVAAVHIKAFNFWRQGRRVERLGWTAGGPRTEEFPRILSVDEVS